MEILVNSLKDEMPSEFSIPKETLAVTVLLLVNLDGDEFAALVSINLSLEQSSSSSIFCEITSASLFRVSSVSAELGLDSMLSFEHVSGLLEIGGDSRIFEDIS